MKKIIEFINNFKTQGWYPAMHSFESAGTEPEFFVKGKKHLMFASNNYLGLSKHPEVIEAAKEGIQKHGLGPGGSRFLCGNIEDVELLEKDLADFVGMEDAITFPTGYMANMAVFRSLLDPFMENVPHPKGLGVLISDEYNHATIVDGGRLTSAKKIVYPHLQNASIKEALEKTKDTYPVMLVTESVYSMDGNLNDINQIKPYIEEYKPIFMVDDAHGIGILGEEGRGASEYFNLNGYTDIIMASMDKALGGMGGFLAGKKEVIEYLRIASRPYIFSSAIPGVMAYSMRKAIEICINDKSIRAQLSKNVNFVRGELIEAGFQIMGNHNLPAIPVLLGDEKKAMKFAHQIFEEGIYTPVVRWPAVPHGEARVRIAVMAHHKELHLMKLVEKYKLIGKKVGLI